MVKKQNNNNKKDPSICCLQETHFRPKDRLKVKGWEEIVHANRRKKKPR